MQPLFLTLVAVLAPMVMAAGLGGGVDMLRGNSELNFTWMEIGFVGLTDTTWYNITTTATNLRDDRNYSVFLSLPEYGGSTYLDGFPLVPRLRGSPVRDSVDNTLTFQARLIQPNDSACAKTWVTPKPLKEIIPVSWLIVQDGVYNITGTENFLICCA